MNWGFKKLILWWRPSPDKDEQLNSLNLREMCIIKCQKATSPVQLKSAQCQEACAQTFIAEMVLPCHRMIFRWVTCDNFCLTYRHLTLWSSNSTSIYLYKRNKSIHPKNKYNNVCNKKLKITQVTTNNRKYKQKWIFSPHNEILLSD